MTYDVTTVKWFPILLEVGLNFSAQEQIFIFPSVQKSQNKLNVSQETFWVLPLPALSSPTSWSFLPFAF